MVENDRSAAAPVAASLSRADSQRCNTEARARRRMPAPDDGGRTAGTAIGWIIWLLLALLMALFLTFGAALPSLAQVEDMATAPSAPQNLAATPGDGQVRLTWEAPADDGDTDVFSTYEYSYHPVGDEEDTRTGFVGGLTLVRRGLTNGTRYKFLVRAENAVGTGPWATTTVTVAALPRPPQNLGATPSDGQVTLTWETPASDGGAPITRYDHSYHRVGGGGVTDVTGDLSLTATVTGLVNGTEYNLLVWAVNSTGAGPWAIVRATPADVPGVPQNLRATSTDGIVFLGWDPPASNGGAPITGHQVRYVAGSAVPDDTAWQESGHQFNAFGLTNGTEYAFEVRAMNRIGGGPAATITATPGTRPGAPQNPAATPGDGQITVSWETPESDGGAPIIRYEYAQLRGGILEWISVGTDLSVTVGNLTNGTRYSFHIRAVNAVGEGPEVVASATPDVDPVVTVHPAQAALSFAEGASDAAVVIVARTEAGVRRPSVEFAVAIVTRAVPGGATSPDDYGVLSVEVTFEPSDFSAVGNAWAASKAVPLTILEDGVSEDDEAFEVRLQMTPGMPLWVHLREADGTTACGNSDCRVTVTIVASGPPSAPRNLISVPGDEEVLLDWDVPAISGGAAITGYEYRHAEGASVPDSTAWTDAGDVLFVRVRNLTNGTEYTFEVRARNDIGAGAAATVTETSETLPGAPQNLTATPGDGQIAFAWQAPADDGGAAIIRYEYRFAEDILILDDTDWVSAGTALTVTLGNLTNGTQYFFLLRAVNSFGGGAAIIVDATPEAAAIIVDATPEAAATVPGPPRDLTASPRDGEAILAWHAPADDGGAVITGYQHRYAEGLDVPGDTAWISAGMTLTVTVTGLASGAGHAFEVRAVNSVGPGAAAGTTASVPALPTLSVADARAREGVDTTIDFAVALSRTSSLTVTVDYATADGSAKAGEDYRKVTGTLTFLAGETEKSVPVALLDDAKDEGEETITLALSRASSAHIARARATGTIVNDDDAMPKAWLVRFGRTIAGQVVDAVHARLDGAPSSHVTVAGVQVGPEASAVLPVRPFDQPDPSPRSLREESRAPSPTVREVMLGSSFHLSSEETGDGPVVSTWGRVAAGGFEARVDGARLDGEVATGLIGVDADWGRVLAGALVEYSEGRGTFALTGDAASERAHGKVESTLAGVYPYIRARVNERTSVWALVGAGAGTLTLAEQGGAPIETDIDMRMGAIGGRETLVPASGADGIALAARVDAFWVRTFSEAVHSEETGHLASSKASANRVRMMLEGERVFALSDGGTITPTVALGARHDGGDAETGAGFEAGAGVRYTAHGVTVEGAVRALVAHDAEGYEEWGASGAIRVDPGISGRGLSLTVAPALGATTAGGTERPRSLRDVQGFAAASGAPAGKRVESELGYGLGAPGGLGAVTPYSGLSVADDGTRTWRIGGRWAVATEVTLGIEASRSEAAGAGPEQALVLRASARW